MPETARKIREGQGAGLKYDPDQTERQFRDIGALSVKTSIETADKKPGAAILMCSRRIRWTPVILTLGGQTLVTATRER